MANDRSNSFDKLVDKLISDDSVDPAVLRDVLQIEANRTIQPSDVQLAKIAAQADARKPWYQWVPWAAFFTFAGGVITAMLTNISTFYSDQDNRRHQISLETLKYEASIFDRLLVVENLPDDIDENEERRARVCFAVRFGLIKVPDYFLVSNVSNREARKKEILKFVSGYGCDGTEIPADIPLEASARVANASGCPSKLPQGQLQYPTGAEDADPYSRSILLLAIGEANAQIHEVCDFERIGEYWASLDLGFDGTDRDIPWSAAFLSWLIDGIGNPNDLTLSAVNIDVWHSAADRTSPAGENIRFVPGERQPRSGDLVFIAREGAVTKDLQTDTSLRVPASTGVVYSIEDEVITYIGGNIKNMVSTGEIAQDNPKIIGYVSFQ